MNDEELKAQKAGADESAKEEELTEEEKAQKREESKKAILEAVKKNIIEKSGMSEEDAEMALEMLDEADMPVAITDEDFKLGRRELDIRKLSDDNFKQMFFRTLLTQGVWLRNISNLLIDLIRLVYVELDALGVENILKKEDAVLSKIHKQQNERIAKEILEKQKKN